jgi:hypothetical protein
VTAADHSLDAELDTLFQQLPSAHVEARTALADKLRKSGDRAGAEQVKKLKRPSASAWAINQLHFHRPALLEAAQQATAALLSLHARDGVGPSELSAAVAAQRRALQAALDAAQRGIEEAGLALSSVDQRKVEITLKAWLAGSGDEAPGRMTHELEASGFAAVTAVGIPSSRPAPPPRPPPAETAETAREPAAAQGVLPLVAAKKKQPGPDPERLARVRANVNKREQEADAARKLSEQVQADLSEKEREVERTREQASEAERTLNALSAQLKQQETALLKRRTHNADASSALSDAERALAAARAELARLIEPK